MRNKFFLLILLVPILVFSQNEETRLKLAEYKANANYTFEDKNLVVGAVLKDVKGTKDDLFSQVKNYIESVYNDHNSTLKIADKPIGVLENESV